MPNWVDVMIEIECQTAQDKASILEVIEKGTENCYFENDEFSLGQFSYQSTEKTVLMFGAQAWTFDRKNFSKFLENKEFTSAVAHHTGIEHVATERFKSIDGKVESSGQWYDGNAKEKFYEFVKKQVGQDLQEYDNDVEEYFQSEGDRVELGTAFAAKFGKEYEPFIGML